MMNEDNSDKNEPRYCKKCGVELPSTDKNKLCINCRKKRGGMIRKVMTVLLSGAGMVFLGIEINKNQVVNSNDEQDEEEDDSSKEKRKL